MATSGKSTSVVGYNLQTEVHTRHHLIVAHEITNAGHDRAALSMMAEQAREATGSESFSVVADRGYFSGVEILACEQAGTTPFVPKPMTSSSKAEGRFGKQDFIYIAADDEYQCPAGQRAIKHFSTVEDDLELDAYWSSACPSCSTRVYCSVFFSWLTIVQLCPGTEPPPHVQPCHRSLHLVYSLRHSS